MAALIQVGLALVLIVSATTGEDKCRTGCQGVTPHNFKYAEGNTYKYDYDGNIDISLCSAEGQHSTTKVKATVLLTQQGQCNQILRVQNLQIVSGDSKKYSNIENIEKPIKLNFHDGHVEDIICTDPSDTQNSLNIKRALASMFQAALKHHGSEIDVFGSCPTEFATHKEGPMEVIKKSRNLNKCAHRESLKQDFMTTAFDLNSEIKSSPFLQGEYESELKVKAGIPQLITVTEKYLYVPFSNEDKGANAKIVSHLKYVGTTKENPKVSCNVPRSIIFDDPHPITSDKSSVGTILTAVKDAAKSIDVTVKADSAKKFSNIIRLMRGATKKDLMAVYSQVRAGAGFSNKEVGKRVFLDALFRVSTGEAVEVAIEIYKSHGLNEIESKLFFVGLSFTRHVTEDALTSAANLLSVENLPREAYLGVGVLAGRYCQQHSCGNVKGLNVLLRTLQSKLAPRPNNREAENLVVTILKAITNAGHVTNALAGKIIEIAQDKQAPSRLRVAALEAYLSDPCNDRFRESAISILGDIQLDSEIRIKAYLALAQCPNGKVATAIKTQLDKEPSVQVGGYIVSHLATLRSSANPDKALAKAQLGEIRTVKKFPVDFRQYSFNGEFSYDFDSLGLAESAESNVIYSQKSFLPRSTSLNLTTEIFGHRYNFLEIDTRQENLDALLSSYVGPNGLLRKESPQNLFSSGSTKIKDLVEKVQEHLRGHKTKREINKNQIENFAKQLTDKQNPLNKDLDLDLSVKLFGSELLFLSLNENIQKYTPEAIIEQIFDSVDKAKAKLNSFEQTLTSNIVFLDAVVSYPTSTGFPLRLSVEGTSSVQVKAAGKLNLDDLLSRGVGDFKLSLIPSVNVELASRFVIDAAVVESGLSVIGNLYSSVGGAFEASLKPGDIEYKLLLPLDKQELLSVDHNIVFETRELCGPQVQTPLKFVQSKVFSVCLDQLSPFIGLTVCADLNQPNIAEASANILPFPLNGNSKLSVSVEKNDFGSFHVHFKEVGSGVEGVYEVLDTSNKPKASFKYELKLSPDPMIILDLTSPVKSARFEGRLVHSSSEVYGLLRLTSDQLEYYLKLGATYASSPTRIVYKPIMEYKAGQGDPQKTPYHITGQIVLEQTGDARTQKYIFDDIKLVGPDSKPIGVTGNIARVDNGIATDLTLDDGTHKGTLKGNLNTGPQGLSMNLQLSNNFNPTANFDVKYKLHFDDRYNIDSNLQFIHGPDLSNKDAVIKLANSIDRKGEGDNYVYSTNHELSYTGLNIDNKFKLKTSQKAMDLEVKFGYKNIKLGGELDVEVDKKTKGDLELELELYGFENKLDIELSRQVSGFKSKVHHKFTLNGNSLEVEGDVKHLIEKQRGDIGQDLVIKITSRPELKWKSEFKYTQNDIDTFIKIQSGQDTWIDAFLKANKAGDANGNLKVLVPGRLKANGQVKANKGSGSSNLLVNFLEIDRKIKGEVSFTVKEPTYNFDVTLYSNFEKDNSRKYHLSTANQIKRDTSIESKNTLEILGQKTVVNFKISHTGDINNFIQGAEYEIILPNEEYFAGKLNRQLKTDKSVINGEGFLNLEQRSNKNSSGRTLVFKAIVKNVNPNEGTLDLSYNLAMDNGAGKTLNGQLDLKKSKSGNERQVEYHGKLHGSILPQPIEETATLKYTDQKADYKASLKYGSSATLNVNGKYELQRPEARKPCTCELHVDVLAPNSRVKTIKFNIQGSLLKPNTDADSLELKGTTALFVDDDGSEQGATLDIKSETDIKLGMTQGHIKETITAQKLDPISLNVGYQYDPDKKYQGDLSIQYAKDKTVKGSLEVDTPNNETYAIDLHLDTPVKEAKQVRLQSHVTNTGNTFKSDSTFSVNDLKYVAQVAVVTDEKQPWYNVELQYPSGKVDKLYSKLLKMDDHSIASESKIILHIYDFSLDTNFDIKMRDVEDFQIKIYVDCPKIQWNKIAVAANTKDVDGTKKLVFNAKEAEKNIVNGVTTYRIRKEEGKIIIDGSGTVTINNEKKSGNFKVLYRDLDKKRDKEEGVQLTINSIVGNKAFDIEYILTTDHFKYLTSYCVEKKECAHVEVEAKEQEDGVDILEINLDLRPLGVSHEFGLKSETHWEQLKHSLDVHLVSNQFKYQYSTLILPTESHFTLTTPKRIVSLESQINSPKNQQPLKGTVVLYLNKKVKPNEKTALEFELPQEKGLEGSIDLKLTTPALKKPLIVNYQNIYREGKESIILTLDLLPTSNKKIIASRILKLAKQGDVVTSQLNSVLDFQALNYKLTEDIAWMQNSKDYIATFDYKLTSLYRNKPSVFSYNAKSSRENSYSKLVLNNHVIFDINSKSKLSKEYSVIETDYKIIGSDPRTTHLEIKDGNTLKFALYKTGKPSRKLQINSGLIPGSIADFRVDIQSENKKIDLIHGSVKLDEADFGKSDYGIDSNNIKEYVLAPAKEVSQNLVNGCTSVLSEVVEEAKTNMQQIRELAKTNPPDYKPVVVYYQSELDALREELVTDKSLKQLGESLSNVVTAVTTVVADLIKTTHEAVDKILNAIQAQSSKVWETIEKDILPQVKQIVTNLSERVVAVLESVTDLVFGVLAQVSAFLDAHQKELKQIATALSQLGKDVVRFINKAVDQVTGVFVSEVNKLTAELKALPIAEDIENYIKQVSAGKSIPEESIQEFKQHVQELKTKIKYKKVVHLIDLTAAYLEKKMRGQKCDDTAEIIEIVKAAIDAVDEVTDDLLFADVDTDFFDLPIPSKILDSLPDYIKYQWSVVNRIMKGDVPDLSQLRSFLTLNPRQWIAPFRKYAIIVQGQHIFTFDGKHITFPGSCSYLLARDIGQDEFTLVGTYVNGMMTELTFADKVDTITVKKNGAVSFNGAAAEFPVRGKNTDAFRTYANIHIKSNTGVYVICLPNLNICLVGVSGFYHGQTRGLLGNANGEPYDDFTTAKGIITPSESVFGNSYKMQGNCADIKTVDHDTHHHSDSCTKVFTEISELSVCYPFVNPSNFRQACDHGVAANIPNTVPVMATAYITACYTKAIPTFLPGEYLTCTNSEKEINLHDTFSVKLPQKSADIVFAIDADKQNAEVYKDLVTALGTSLIKDLGSKGIKDVEYHVLTYGGDHPDWPSHITTNGGKMTFKGKMPNLKFSEAPDEDDIDVGHDGVNFFISLIKNYIDELNLVIGNEPQSRAYLEAIEFPFRTHAVKAIVAVSSEPCQKAELQWLQKLRAAILRQPSISLNLITPLGKDCDFKVKDEKTTKNVIGFNSEGVITFSDAKKMPTGNPNLLKDLEYNDFCSEYTSMSGGNVFILDNFNKNKKLFTTVVSHNIAESLASVEQGLDCICLRNGWHSARNRCRLVHSQKKPSSKKLLKG